MLWLWFTSVVLHACFGPSVFPHRLLDPKTLSVPQLKALLDTRGVSYWGVVEKDELSDLVRGSGPVGEDAVKLATKEAETEAKWTELDTVFESGEQFRSQVLESKNTVWLLKVQTIFIDNPFPLKHWQAIQKRLRRFGIKTASVKCFDDNIKRFCREKWQTSQVVLAVPVPQHLGTETKNFSFTGDRHEEALFKWVLHQLSSTVTPITSLSQFQEDWEIYQSRDLATEIRVIIFQSKQYSIPMFFSALSVKFPRQVRFGRVDINSACGRNILEKHNWMWNSFDTKGANYVILSSKTQTIYGQRAGENLSFSTMENLLISLFPSSKDVFMIISAILMLLLWLEMVVLPRSSLKERLQYFARDLVCLGMLLLVLWLTLMMCLLALDWISYIYSSFSWYVWRVAGFSAAYLCYKSAAEIRNFGRLLGSSVAAWLNSRSDQDASSGGRLHSHHAASDGQMLGYWDDIPSRKFPRRLSNSPGENIHSVPIASYPHRSYAYLDGSNDQSLLKYEMQDRMFSHNAFIRNALNLDQILRAVPVSTKPIRYVYDGRRPMGECSICQEKPRHGDVVIDLPCSHTFHSQCILEWVRTAETCPNCRSPVAALPGE